jgi:hypothetical protein
MCTSLAYTSSDYAPPEAIYDLDFDLWDICCELSSKCEYFEEVDFGY